MEKIFRDVKYHYYYNIVIFFVIICTLQILLPDTKFISNTLQISTQLAVAQLETNNSNFQTVDYYARFNCGTISDDKGPLRPGMYDSDITVFNKKNFPLSIIWKAIEINQENPNNFKIINLQPESVVNINCAKIFPFPEKGENSLQNRFVEGVLLLRINTDNGQLTNNFFNNKGQSIFINKEELGDLVNVDVLHTVNTLSDLNKEAFYLKIDFTLEQQGKQSKDELENNLTAIFQIEPNKIIDPVGLIKQAIDNSNNNTIVQQPSTNNATIKIIRSETFSNSYTDNHALTFQKIDPTFTK
jgi:hypothetical protein